MSADVGERVRALRESRNKTQEEVAAAVSVRVAHYSRIERGSPTWMSLRVATRLAAYFEVSLDELVTGSGAGYAGETTEQWAVIEDLRQLSLSDWRIVRRLVADLRLARQTIAPAPAEDCGGRVSDGTACGVCPRCVVRLSKMRVTGRRKFAKQAELRRTLLVFQRLADAAASELRGDITLPDAE